MKNIYEITENDTELWEITNYEIAHAMAVAYDSEDIVASALDTLKETKDISGYEFYDTGKQAFVIVDTNITNNVSLYETTAGNIDLFEIEGFALVEFALGGNEQGCIGEVDTLETLKLFGTIKDYKFMEINGRSFVKIILK